MPKTTIWYQNFPKLTNFFFLMSCNLANLNNCGEERGQKRVVGKGMDGNGDGHKRDLGVGGLVNRM